MTLTGLFFYLFSAVLVASGLMVIAARQPVHSVLFLILGFVNAAGLFMLLGAEFLALILVVVYVGAVAVLFLFVVMMLDIDFAELRQGFLNYLPVGALVGVVILVELLVVVGGRAIAPEVVESVPVPIPDHDDVSNTEAIGQLLYTRYLFYFQAAGLILLVAMVGAIVLTLRHKEGVKRQSAAVQIARNPATAIEVRKVEPGKGLS
ncbi:MAG: NADH-quinone oxidoreductase subunit J [Bauldia sp.]|nr:NADH-quinone oxidoreductase subunit J [Bauldia sp.]